MDDLKTLLLTVQGQIADLQGQMKALRASDRRQWEKLQAQQRHNAVFAGVIAIGVLLGVGELTSEDKASLQQVLVAVIVAAGGAGGIIGVNSAQANQPPGDNEDAD